jgi:hypothetical protein
MNGMLTIDLFLCLCICFNVVLNVWFHVECMNSERERERVSIVSLPKRSSCKERSETSTKCALTKVLSFILEISGGIPSFSFQQKCR